MKDGEQKDKIELSAIVEAYHKDDEQIAKSMYRIAKSHGRQETE